MDEAQLKKLLKAQLMNIARQRGVYVASSNTKDVIIRKIIGAGSAPAPAPAPARVAAPAAPSANANLKKLLKPQLMNMARQRGVYVASKNSKDAIIQKILAARNRPAAHVNAPKPVHVNAPKPAPTKKRNPLFQVFANEIKKSTKSEQIQYLRQALNRGVVNKNSNNYKQLKSLIRPDKTINNLYKMSNNNIKAEYKATGFVKNISSRNSMIRGILSVGSGNTGIHGGGKISNSLINAPPAKGVCRSGRLQITGTCWFQSLLNPFLLSDIGRDILATKLAEFKQSNNMKKWTNINACPYRLSGAFFWSYIEYKLKEDYTNIEEYKKTMKGELFTNERLIRNIKLKKNNQNINGGGFKQFVKFLNEIFKDDYAHKTIFRYDNFNTELKKAQTIRRTYNANNKIQYKLANNDPLLGVLSVFDIKNDFQVPKTITMGNYKYNLFGSYLSGYGEGEGGHAMTGYLCGDDNYMFYDSNSIRTTKLDWTTKSFWKSEFKEYLTRYWEKTGKIEGNFFYIRAEEIPRKVNQIPQVKKLNTNNKPKANTNNKPVAWYKKLFK